MKCPSCGKENPAVEQYCLDCGTELTVHPAAPAAPSGPSADGSSRAMSDAEFQQLLHSPPAAKSCPHCGVAAPAGGSFCDNCGEALTAPALSPAVSAEQPAGTAPPSTTPPVAPPSEPIGTTAGAASGAASAPSVEATVTAAAGVPTPAPEPGVVTLDIGGPTETNTVTMSAGELRVGRRDPDAGIYPEIDFEGNDIVVDGGERVHAVSRRHGRIFRDGDVLKYEDLGSTNGSTLNGAAVLPQDPQPLRDGDKIVLGRTCRIAVHVA